MVVGRVRVGGFRGQQRGYRRDGAWRLRQVGVMLMVIRSVEWISLVGNTETGFRGMCCGMVMLISGDVRGEGWPRELRHRPRSRGRRSKV
jgi:hypothetical protein